MIEYQKSLAKIVELRGVGLHSGREVNIRLHPAPANHGYVFKRVDLDGHPLIPADVDFVTDVSRGTTLEYKGASVATVEHLLAAFVGLGIDNALIELDGPEVPIMDGSAAEFLLAIKKGGVEELEDERNFFEIDENVIYEEKERKVEILAVPSDEYKLTVMIDYDSPVLGNQHASIENISEFEEHIAASRTFCFLHELELLLENNLIKGGDLNNAIVVVDKVVTDKELSRLATLFGRPKIEVKQEGILNNVDLRFPNEPARHKLLDVLGDLALIGRPIKGKITASRPGHAANIAFAKKIKALIKERRKKNPVPKYDPSKEPIYDNIAIQKILPHKYPFLLVDKIIELSKDTVVGIKNVTVNEPFFQGHFPGNPVMPGVLQLEAFAQTGGILLLQEVDDPANYDTYFLMIDRVKFKNVVRPGDTLILKLSLLSPIRRGICEMQGIAYVGDKVASEAKLVAKIIRKEQV